MRRQCPRSVWYVYKYIGSKRARCVCMHGCVKSVRYGDCAVSHLHRYRYTHSSVQSHAFSRRHNSHLCCFIAATKSAVQIFCVCVCQPCAAFQLCDRGVWVSKRSREKHQNYRGVPTYIHTFTDIKRSVSLSFRMCADETLNFLDLSHTQFQFAYGLAETALTYSIAHQIDILQWHVNTFQSIIQRATFYYVYFCILISFISFRKNAQRYFRNVIYPNVRIRRSEGKRQRIQIATQREREKRMNINWKATISFHIFEMRDKKKRRRSRNNSIISHLSCSSFFSKAKRICFFVLFCFVVVAAPFATH